MTTEKVILKNLVKNEDYVRKVLPFIQDEYFGNSHERIFFSHVRDYFNQYNSLPSVEALAIVFSNDKKINEKDFELIKNTLEEISSSTEDTNTQFLINTTEQFCKDKAIYNAILKSVNIIDGKDEKLDKGALPKLLSDALAVSFDRHVGHDYIENSDERYDFYHRVENKIPFGLEYFNKITSGGISEKTLTVILAGTGVGKSLFMCDMASSAFMMGKNVLYITLEMAEERIAERIDSNLLNIPIIEMRKISEENFNKKISAVKSRTNGKLVVKEYPTASANTNHFRSLINELQMKKNFVPDIIFIDYLNICTSARLKVGSNVNSYTFIKAIAEEIRGLAVECSIPIVTATQTTRSGYSNSDIGLEDTSESFGLPATADLMFALISTEELEALNQIMVKQLKNRYNDPTTYRKFVVGIDRSRMKLYDVDQSAQTLVDSGQDEDEDETPLETVNKSPFKFKNKFSDFKF